MNFGKLWAVFITSSLSLSAAYCNCQLRHQKKTLILERDFKQFDTENKIYRNRQINAISNKLLPSKALMRLDTYPNYLMLLVSLALYVNIYHSCNSPKF